MDVYVSMLEKEKEFWYWFEILREVIVSSAEQR